MSKSGVLTQTYEGMWYGKPKTFSYVVYEYDMIGTSTRPVNGKFRSVSAYTGSWRRVIRPIIYESSIGNPYFWARYPQNFVSNYAVDTIWNHVSVSNAQLAAIGNVGDTKMTLGETLAESRGSFDMIRNNVSAIAHMLLQLKRGNVKGAANAVGLYKRGLKNTSSDASSKYLELIFGWKPLIDEVHNGIDVMQNGLNTETSNAIISGVIREKLSLTRKVPASASHGPYTTTSDMKGHVKVTYSYLNGNYGRQLNQLGILNLPSVAYAVMPHSYLLDWFIPVGSYLEAFSATSGCTFLGAYASHKSKHVSSVEPDGSTRTGAFIEEGVTQRRMLSVVPPLPEFRLPSSMQQATTAVALALQRAR